jgi:hypothetical protein
MEDEVFLMRRSDGFDPDLYGFAFFADGRFIEHKNNCSCGTPPIIYEEYEGSWMMQSEQTFEIQVGFWGGQTSYKMDVLSVDAEILKFSYQH